MDRGQDIVFIDVKKIHSLSIIKRTIIYSIIANLKRNRFYKINVNVSLHVH